MRIGELILYKSIRDNQTLWDLKYVLEKQGTDEENTLTVAMKVVSSLLETACSHGYYGNLLHCYVANLIVNDENSYSLQAEQSGSVGGSLDELVLHDCVIIQEILGVDLSQLASSLHIPEFKIIADYKSSRDDANILNRRIRDRICSLASQLGKQISPDGLRSEIAHFYMSFGVGSIGLNKAFRLEEDEIVPIRNIPHVQLSDLVGTVNAKKKLTDNTDAFVAGRPANNCLLYGDAGTGKSTCIKALANEYYDKGLRIIEVYKHQFKHLNSVIAKIKNRNYKFIIFMDDLSFEEFEIDYKYLKAIIEGGLEKKPSNVLIYATSNRRHIVNERFSDREDAIHASDTMQEKLSLSSRFGCQIYFSAPEKREFIEIVTTLAEREKLTIPEDELIAGALSWELSHGGRNGRCARQYIDYLLGGDIDNGN